jgi:5-methyltetrahydropteroyltriglutamate--homocysteine methyltransferase
MFETTLVGSQPKIFDDSARPNLRLARNRLDKGKITQADLDDVTRGAIKAVADDQIACGIDRVTDGRVRWDDPVTPFAAAHDGFEIGGLIRFFDNNVYYRRPNVNGPVRFVHSAVVEDFRFLRELTDRPILASVCGPFSLAKFCVDQNYEGGRMLYEDCARLVRAEIEALAHAGADWVQIDEPFLALCPKEFSLAIETIRATVPHNRVKTLLYTYFGSLGPIADRIWDLPVHAIGADCATAPGNLEILLRGPKTIGRVFGLLDARSTRLEPVEHVTSRLERIANSDASQWPIAWIAPSAALEFLPYKNAIAKMRRLTEAVRAFQGETVAAL